MLPPTLEDSLPPTIENLFDTVRSGVQRSAEMYINLCTLFERLVKRNEGLASDFSRVSLLLQSLTEVSAETYHMDTNDVPLLNEGINSTFKHVATHQGLIEEESRAWDEGVLEDLKRQRDTLVSMRDMFDRRDRYAKENIPQLERRIAGNENKLSGVRAKPEGVTKPGEAEKLEDAIMKVRSHLQPTTGTQSLACPLLHDTDMIFIGQGVHSPATRPRCAHQRMYTQRNPNLSELAIQRQPVAPRLER